MKKRKRYTVTTFKRHVLAFSAITIVALALVVYFSFARTVISVTPALQTEEFSMALRIVNSETVKDSPDMIAGSILSQDVDVEIETSDFTKTAEAESKAVGKVTIHNNSSRMQPLQTGTRLLSEGGVLFRTTERVDVGPGTSVTATVIADQAGKQGDIPPSRFEIVALWEGLKPLIYGESTERFSGGIAQVTILTQEDYSRITQQGRQALKEQAQSIFEGQLTAALTPHTYLAALAVANPKESLDATVGDSVSRVTYSGEGSALAIAVNETEFNDAIRAYAETLIGPSFTIVDLPADKWQITITESDADAGTATIRVEGVIEKTATLKHQLFDAEQLTNQSKKGIYSYFDQFEEIASVDVTFSPFWVIRTPNLVDHIEIKLGNPESVQ